MSTLKTNNIQHVDRSDPSILINTDGSVSIAGTMTYEDVTNVDSVGIITGRELINAQKQVHVGTGVSIAAGGLNVTAGISTFGGDVSIADKIIHTGDTNTAIRFPSADTVSVETGGSEKLRITTEGHVLVGLTTNANTQMVVYGDGTTDNKPAILFQNNLTGTTNSNGFYVGGNSGADSKGYVWNYESNSLVLATSNTQRLVITSLGTVNIGDVDHIDEEYLSSTLKIQKDQNSITRFVMRNENSGSGSASAVQIGASGNSWMLQCGSTANDSNAFTIRVDGTSNSNTGTEKLRLDTSGRLLLGTTTEGYDSADDLTVATSGNTGITIRSGTGDLGTIAFSDATSGTGEYQGYIQYGQDDNYMDFSVDAGTKVALKINAESNATFAGIVTATEFIPTESQLSNRNRIINGSMRIAQRATSSTSQGIRTCDRWDTYAAGMDQLAYTQKQVTDSPDGFGYSYEIDITTAESAQAGDEYMRVQQKIEAQDLQYLAYGTSSAKTVTVSFWVKAYQTGTYVVNFYRQDATRQITRTYTVNASATWEYKSVTIPGDTTGGGINNDTGAGIHLAFILIADSGYTSTDSTSWINYTDAGYGYGQTVNLGSSTNNYWKITGVQFEQGSQPTPFENQKFGDELQLCQRYYQTIPSSLYIIRGSQDIAYSNAALQTSFILPEPMRATPTASNYDDGGSTITVTYYNASYGNATNYEGHIGSNIVNGIVRFQIGHNQVNNSSTTLSTTYKWGVTSDSIAFDSEI